MTRLPYRHAIWPPSPGWVDGYQYGAPTAVFVATFPTKVREHGPPLRVWDTPAGEPPKDDEI